MNDVLHHYLDLFVIVYLDDILVYSATWEDHTSHLMHALDTLKKHQLLANINKCEFSQLYLVYLVCNTPRLNPNYKSTYVL
jgi:hypothetical protein